MSPKGKKATATKATNDPLPLAGAYAGTSPRGDTNWGDRDEDDTTDEKDKVDPKKSEDGITTDEDDDKPQQGNEIPVTLPIANDLFLDEYNKVFADHKKIREDKSLSEEVRVVHLRKSKLRVDARVTANWARNEALIPPDEASDCFKHYCLRL
jgi:hypothetical protein